jgi:small subunit ribosomal protein S16
MLGFRHRSVWQQRRKTGVAGTGVSTVSSRMPVGRSCNAGISALPMPACLLARRSHRRRKEIIMVVIRLARGGAKKRPFYNIVVANSQNRRDGRYLERVGFYNPMASGGEQPLRVAIDRVTYWTGVGAQLSPTVQRLVDQAKAATPAAAA